NTGTGAELYTVIGHAPRQLDRNIALVGRIIDGMEHMSSLPRGHGELGFYDLAKGDERVPILAVRLAAEVKDLPAYEYLDTEKASFAKYADARANRRDPFYIRPAGGVDVCNVPVPVRRAQ
ncbi:MAG: peptidylprolyl isomerase, partial [Novosphingobium sp.]